MVDLNIREEIPDGAIILENYAYDNSIVGITTDGRVVYDFYRMVEEFAMEEDCTTEEAMDWICYNTLRAIPYMGEMAPIVMYGLE